MKKSTKNKVYQRLSTWKIVTLFLVMTFLGMQSATAQYTAIPDANFEHALFTLGIDTIDGDHQVLTSAVSGVTSLDVSLSGISDLTGIQEFTSLQTLYCYNNLLTSLNLSGLTNLQILGCESNLLTSLNVNGLTNLQILQCGGNQLSSLNVSGLNSLSYLDCDTNQLPSLNVSGLTNLQNLDCRYNQLASLNLSGLTNNFMFLSCSYNQLTNINVSGYINLETIYCNNNQLTSLNASGLTNLNYLYCGANQLTSLNLTGSRYLESFDCISNPNLTCISVFDPTAALANLNWTKDATTSYATNCSLGSIAAVISGTTSICSGGSTTINVAITGGTSPFTLVYSDGTKNNTITGYVSGIAIPVSPTANTTYSIASVTDAASNVGTGNSGTAVITVNPTTPTFSAIAPIAPGTTLSALPTTSNNGITGTWSPALYNTHNTTYTFTPDAGQCATNTITLDITVQIRVCHSGTVADLTPNDATIKWYAANTGGTKLALTSVLSTKTYYYTQTVAGVEGPRYAIAVVVNKPAAPTALNQVFCLSGTVSDLTATGSDILWYTTTTSGSPINPSTPIASATYYASQTIYGCESISRKPVTVKLNITSSPVALSSQTFCSGAKVSNLAATGTLLKWYTSPNAGVALATTDILSSGTYYVSQTVSDCKSLRTVVTVVVNNTPAPIASSQTLYYGSKIANLTATGTNIKWYNTSTGGTVLAATTFINSGTYYASQTSNGCESERTAVTITLISVPLPNAAPQTLCNISRISDLIATGSNLKWYTDPTGGVALPGAIILTTKTYYVSQTLNGAESARIAVPITINTTPTPWSTFQSFTYAATVADLVATGTDIKWYATTTGGTPLDTTTLLVSNVLYYCSQTINGCESTRRAIVVRIAVALIGNVTNTAIAKTETSPTEFKIYPNPTSNSLTIATSNDNTIDKVVVIDLFGKVILEETPINNQIKVEQFPTGTYIIQISSGEEKFLTKFIKE